jgi:pyruvate dehydrogenase E1 component alpha subunit
MDGKSMALCFPEHKIYSSAIVGGSAPWALGVALSIKRRGGSERVFCFVGDMTSETGILQTCITYALNHELPLTFVVEDNNNSVMTDTRKVWNSNLLRYELQNYSNLIAYKYKSNWPHAGAGQRVQF